MIHILAQKDYTLYTNRCMQYAKQLEELKKKLITYVYKIVKQWLVQLSF